MRGRAAPFDAIWGPGLMLGLLVLSVGSCGRKAETTSRPKPGTVGEEKKKMTLIVTSPAFEAGQPIPKKHAYKGEGENVSPPLAWSGAPAGTKSFALIVDDPDAPSPQRPRPNPWVHWVLWNVPGDRTSLAAGDHGGGVSGTSDFGHTGWGGPMPPPGSGTHRYFFKVYALGAPLTLPSSATKAEVLKAMQGNVLAEGSLYGTYERH